MPEFEKAKDFPRPCDNLHEFPLVKWGKLLFAGLNPSFDFQKERWVPVPTELERKHTLANNVWIHGKKDKVELEVIFQRGSPGKSAGSYLVSQKVNVISGRAATDQIYESEWTGVGPNLEKRGEAHEETTRNPPTKRLPGKHVNLSTNMSTCIISS